MKVKYQLFLIEVFLREGLKKIEEFSSKAGEWGPQGTDFLIFFFF